ncbi:type III secretion system inner membrane ring lipoprotein SctJ [Noviherbaspirillum album]|nr:type III secretion inner membrane ring lipoprotein SctJ [Noviherbaspirillum sp. CPCC 100848]
MRWRQCLLAGACALTMLLAGCGGKIELIAGLQEMEANEVLAALADEGITTDKVPGKEGTVSLNVAQDQAARAINVLRERGLPRERFAGMGDVFKKEGLISSPLEEQARYLYALSQELSNTLRQVDGVLTARVHLVLPERGTLEENMSPSSAAVFLKHQTGYNLDTLQPQIRKLVTNSIPGLTPEKVTIVLVSAQTAQKRAQDRTVSVLGFEVAQASASRLTGTVLALLAVVLASLAGTAFMAWKYVIQPRRIAGN